MIDLDPDCQQVENFAFDLFLKSSGSIPVTDKEKIRAFELFRRLLLIAKNKSSINKTRKLLKKYSLISGGLDTEKIYNTLQSTDSKDKNDFSLIQTLLKVALKIMKTGDFIISKGMKGKELNIFIIEASELLALYCKLQNNSPAAEYYNKINHHYKKYFMMQEE